MLFQGGYFMALPRAFYALPLWQRNMLITASCKSGAVNNSHSGQFGHIKAAQGD